jgi:hypothetical protein
MGLSPGSVESRLGLEKGLWNSAAILHHRAGKSNAPLPALSVHFLQKLRQSLKRNVHVMASNRTKNKLRSSAKAPAPGERRLGCFSRHFRQIASSSTGMSGCQRRRCHVPDPHSAVLPRGSQIHAVRAKGYGEDVPGMGLQQGYVLARRCIPEMDRALLTCRGW